MKLKSKINYDKKMQEILNSSDSKKKLLLHVCCAPCFSGAIDRLKDVDLTLFFYNPNISSQEEYDKRAQELVRFNKEAGINAEIILADYDPSPFIKLSKGLENEPERGRRCLRCYRERLEKTRDLADELGFDYFATTLTLSPQKNSQVINEIGQSLGEKYLVTDFKKNNGFLNSVQLCKEYDLYRQNYCGCEFSKRG